MYELSEQDFFKYPLVCRDLQKIYDASEGRSEVFAVKSFSLLVEPGEIFGLLGPNGAGKTTIISMLTGLYNSTQGNGWVAGFDVNSRISDVHLRIGVCP